MRPDDLLKTQLGAVLVRQRWSLLWNKLALCWAAAALLSFLLLLVERLSGWALSFAPGLILASGLIAAVTIGVWQLRRPVDWRELARQIETRHPQLEGRLLTAVQQDARGDELNYLQQRLIDEVLQDSRQNDWAEAIPASRLALAQTAHWTALGLFALTLWNLPRTHSNSLVARISDFSIAVNPGDTTLERGSSLVVMARFTGAVPPGAELVIAQPPVAGTRRIPLVKSLADPIFGGSVPEVATNLVYHVRYAGRRTRDFHVTVFDYPRLEHADANITYPDYTGQSPKRIENTRRLSAVEGSSIDVKLKLNKPVVAARLVAKDNDRSVLPLTIESDRAAAALKQFRLLVSKTYDLQLVDAAGRTNKVPAQFVFDALTNRRPELRLAAPRGDLRPSAIEEIVFEGTVWDDFGVRDFGLAYASPGQEVRWVELGSAVPAQEKRSFQYVLRLEDIGVQPDELLTWFAWAEDTGPDGKLRRTETDLYFAEVRPFEEVFREGQQPDGQSSGPQESQSGKLVELQKKILSATWNLQRQQGISVSSERKISIPGKNNPDKPAAQPRSSAPPQSLKGARQAQRIFGLHGLSDRYFGQPATPSLRTPSSPGTNSATLEPSPPGTRPLSYQDDAATLRDSQSQALEQAEAAASDARDPRAQALWTATVREMERALEHLNQATNSPEPLPAALTSEQSAYQALLKLQEHEYQVVRNRKGNRGGGNNDRWQQQLEQMDLAKSEDRYETQRQAQKPQNHQFREQLQVMNRLQELARRQQDFNDRLKELQTALQEARTEQEREEIRRRLKRLQEEEQQMLADVDELRQRMDRPENQSRMAEERKQLEQTREELQRAAQASSQGTASQALAAGTRAQRQLQQMRDQMRQESSNQFSDDLRQMRTEARELARQQEDLVKQLVAENGGQRKSLSDAVPTEDLVNRLAQQKQRMTNLVERATQVSQQAEEPEPLLSRQLYDTVRKFAQENLKNVQEAQDELINRRLMSSGLYDVLKDASNQDGPKLLELTSELLRQNFRGPAAETAQRAQGTIEQLKKGIQRAAESILGDDFESLRLAREELEQLTQQLAREMAQAQAGDTSTNLAPELGPQTGTLSRSSSQFTPRQDSSAEAGGEQRAGEQKRRDQAGRPTDSGSQAQDAQQEGQADRGGQSSDSQQVGTAGGGRPGAVPAASAQRGGPPSGEQDGGGNTSRDWLRSFDRSWNDDRLLQGGPITGGAFGPWSDRLREVEELIDFSDLRHQVATARERARLLRQTLKSERKKPDWAVVQLQVMKPLIEVRDRIADELARRESADALVPIDRDPVPIRYSDLVRRYYEELGKDRNQDRKVLNSP